HDPARFAVNHEVDPNAPSIRIGTIVGGGELRLPISQLSENVMITGASGAGKTELILQTAVNLVVERYLESQDDPSNPFALVLIDMEKIDNYPAQLAGRINARLRELGIEETLPVNCITPGRDEVTANVDLLDCSNTTPDEQIDVITHALGATIPDD